MTRQHPSLTRIIRRLRPSPDRLAAAGAVQDASLLLALQTARSRRVVARSLSPAR